MKVLNLDLANKSATLEAFGETRTVVLEWFNEASPTNNPNRKPFFQAYFKGMGYRVGRTGKKIHAGSTGIFKVEEDTTPRQLIAIKQNTGNRDLQIGDYYISGTGGVFNNGYNLLAGWYDSFPVEVRARGK